MGMYSLTSKQLERLKKHKYCVEGKSVIERRMDVFHDWIVTKLPLWLAPNVMTLSGLILNLISCGPLIYLSRDGKTSVAQYWFCICIVFTWIAEVLDCCDGKQARRTKSSSPLGELLDHGCDSVTSALLGISCVCALRVGDFHLFCILISALPCTVFYSAHWQTYVSGTLKVGFIDAAEHLLLVRIIFLAAVFTDVTKLQQPMFGYPLVSIVATICALWAASQILIHIYKASTTKPTVCEGSALAPLFPALMTCFPSLAIYLLNPKYYLAHPMLYLCLFNLVSVKLILLIIVSHMTKTRLPQADQIYVIPIMFLAHHFSKTTFDPQTFMVICFALAVCDIVLYSSLVCSQICDYLNIYMFKINVTNKK